MLNLKMLSFLDYVVFYHNVKRLITVRARQTYLFYTQKCILIDLFSTISRKHKKNIFIRVLEKSTTG